MSEPADGGAASQQEAAPGSSATTVERLAGRGEETLRRLLAELDRRARLNEAKGRVQRVPRSVLERLGIASQDDVDELRRQVARLEERLGASDEPAGQATLPSSSGDV